MELATVIGLVVGIGACIVSVLAEGGHLSALVNPPAAIIVFGGTFGATMICFRLSDMMSLPIVLKQAFFSTNHDAVSVIRKIVEMARLARSDGFLGLEKEVEEIAQTNPFLAKALQMVADGTAPETVSDVLETELFQLEQRHHSSASIMGTMGGLAPTLGVTGTVMGLVHMMGSLDDPSSMGPAIAGAFLATLYGVASANLVFLPLANKLKLLSKQEQFVSEIIIEGVRLIQKGESPILVAESLKAFVTPKLRSHLDDNASAPSQGGDEVERQAKAS